VSQLFCLGLDLTGDLLAFAVLNFKLLSQDMPDWSRSFAQQKLQGSQG
jgi:hypothetical protein